MSTTCIPQIADHYPVEPLPKNWITAKVRFRHRDGREDQNLQIIDLKSETRYLHEPLKMTAYKCFQLVFGIPFYFLAYTAWNLLRIPMTTGTVLGDGLGETLRSRRCSEVMQHLYTTAKSAIKTLASGIKTIVIAPFYLIQMFFGALIGVFSPLQGRKILGSEIQLHQKTTRDDFLRHPPLGDSGKAQLQTIWQSLTQEDCPATVFVAYCMQPLGKTTDPHIISIQQVLPQQA